jgi:hypothetical protein
MGYGVRITITATSYTKIGKSISAIAEITMMIDTTLKPATSRIPYPISVQQQPNSQWLAQVLGWTDCQVEAPSREAAIAKIDQALKPTPETYKILLYPQMNNGEPNPIP